MSPTRALAGACLLLIAVLVAPRATAQVIPDERPVRRLILSNGLTALIVEDHRSPLVGLELRYRVGSRDDPPGRAGLAAFVQKLMVRATTHVPEGDYERLLRASGSFGATATTRPDYSAFNLTIPAGRLPLPLWLWSDQMGYFSPRIDEQLIAQEFSEISDEAALGQNSPSGRVPELIAAELYPTDHPYRSAMQRGVQLEGVAPSELRAFVESHYTPDRAILAVVGDIRASRAEQLVRQYFEPLRAPAPSPRTTATSSELTKDIRLDVAVRSGSPSVTIVWPTPSIYAYGDAHLDVFAGLLAGPRVGWLYAWLVDGLGIAGQVTAHETSREFASEFVIYSVATRGHTADELLSAIDMFLRYIDSHELDDNPTRLAISRLARERSFDLEHVGRRATAYVECEIRGIHEGCLRRWISWYGGISGKDLSNVVHYNLPLTKRVVVETTPTSDAPVSGELRGRRELPP